MSYSDLVHRPVTRRQFGMLGLGAMALAAAAISGCAGNEQAAKPGPTFPTVRFGSYPQSAGDGGSQALEWYALEEREDGSKLLLCRDCVERLPYNDEWVETTWADCSLRAWLNGEFLQTAFTEEERARILQTDLTDVPNPRHGTDPGEPTLDRVFLLSIAQAEQYRGDELQGQGFPQLSAVPSARLAEQGAYADGGRGGIVWWLRSPGSDRLHAAQVNSDGATFLPGTRVDDGDVAVRPALVLGR